MFAVGTSGSNTWVGEIISALPAFSTLRPLKFTTAWWQESIRPSALEFFRMFSPDRIGDLSLRNRIIRAGCFEGMAQEGDVTENLIDHHRRLPGSPGRQGLTRLRLPEGSRMPAQGYPYRPLFLLEEVLNGGFVVLSEERSRAGYSYSNR